MQLEVERLPNHWYGAERVHKSTNSYAVPVSQSAVFYEYITTVSSRLYMDCG
jgi:hypothetical protein